MEEKEEKKEEMLFAAASISPQMTRFTAWREREWKGDASEANGAQLGVDWNAVIPSLTLSGVKKQAADAARSAGRETTVSFSGTSCCLGFKNLKLHELHPV